MKFVLATLLVASVAAQTADWSPCTKQDCTSKGWICCDTTEAGDDGQKVTGTMICTDPSIKGIVPSTGGDYAGNTYHCSADQHKDIIDAGAATEGASRLVMGAAALASAYMLA